MFIPPEGAMQFELQRDEYGAEWTPTIAVWVKPVLVKSSGGCPCGSKTGYPVITESIMDREAREATLEEIADSGCEFATACACMGRIIE